MKSLYMDVDTSWFTRNVSRQFAHISAPAIRIECREIAAAHYVLNLENRKLLVQIHWTGADWKLTATWQSRTNPRYLPIDQPIVLYCESVVDHFDEALDEACTLLGEILLDDGNNEVDSLIESMGKPVKRIGHQMLRTLHYKA